MKLQVPGFVAGGIAAGIKKDGSKDLGIIFSEVPASSAGVFTTNQVQAAPVLLDKERIKSGQCQAVLVNSGNANACTGPQGLEDAKAMAHAAAIALGVEEELVLVASTGVIGRLLDLPAIETAISKLSKQLTTNGLFHVAQAIMTTDTFPKAISREVPIGDRRFTVGAVAKGAGMIRPHMATMLCFVCTDLGATPEALNKALATAVATSFNAITVDGDTSTNDTVLLLANGLSGLHLDEASCAKAFQEALNDVLGDLALQIVQDAEGATKVVTIQVKGAPTVEDARDAAYTVANSPLVKTAFFGADANWGRIMAAVGRAGVPVNPELVDLYFNDVQVVKDGQGCGQSAEAAASKILESDRFTISIDLRLGSAETTVYTCDLSTDYVKINANYRT